MALLSRIALIFLLALLCLSPSLEARKLPQVEKAIPSETRNLSKIDRVLQSVTSSRIGHYQILQPFPNPGGTGDSRALRSAPRPGAGHYQIVSSPGIARGQALQSVPSSGIGDYRTLQSVPSPGVGN
ncbi:hypothetical protein JCGZ_13467 [Jatropha curcas]|uniref:Uncharacterized protein n=1 Tax=Jatropha curcas TaxID=180498 RepID=A0A067LC03_JATCU|nr:uncharacterized protein LOC119370509 [Jatropha curcas]KDP46021.1 hypothetical protein JCGZ_13467 [Jatropha curcas]